MVAPRRSRWVLLIAAVVISAGFAVMVIAVSPSGTQATASIAPNDTANGTEYFAEFGWSVLAGGAVEGTFRVLNDTPVTVYVLDSADFNSFVNGANLTGLYTTTASSGSIDVRVSGWDAYHLVFAHSPAYRTDEQDVAVSLTTVGIDPGFFLSGIAGLVMGGLLIVYARRRSRRPPPAAPDEALDSEAVDPLSWGLPSRPSVPPEEDVPSRPR